MFSFGDSPAYSMSSQDYFFGIFFLLFSGVVENGDTRGGILWCHPLRCIIGDKSLYLKDSGVTSLVQIAVVIWLAQ